MSKNQKMPLQPIINIYIVGSNGITIGDKNNIDQTYSTQSDISKWTNVQKLSLAYLTRYLDEVPFLADDNSIEFINLDISEYLNEDLGMLQKTILASREKLESLKLDDEKYIEVYKSLLDQMLSNVSQALGKLIDKREPYKQAFDDLQTKLEKRGAPQAIAYKLEDISINTGDLLDLAKLHYGRDETNQAAEILKRYLKTNPNSLEGQALLMECLIFSRKFIEAIDWSDSCPDQMKNASFRSYLIVAYKNLREDVKAKEEINKFINDFPDHPNTNEFRQM